MTRLVRAACVARRRVPADLGALFFRAGRISAHLQEFREIPEARWRLQDSDARLQDFEQIPEDTVQGSSLPPPPSRPQRCRAQEL